MNTESRFAAHGLAVLAMALLGVQTTILAVLHMLPTGLDPGVHFVSEYGIGPYRWLAMGKSAAALLGVVALLGGLVVSRVAPLRSAAGIALLIHLAGRVLILGFPVDPVAVAVEGGGLPDFTVTGWIHVLSGQVAALSMMTAMVLLTLRVRRMPGRWPAAGLLVFFCVAAPAGFVGTFVVQPAAFPAGLVQRVFLVSALGWQLLFTWGLIRATSPAAVPVPPNVPTAAE